MPFVIRDEKTKKYVAKRGMTKQLARAERFASQADISQACIEREITGNFRAIRLTPMMNGQDQNLCDSLEK